MKNRAHSLTAAPKLLAAFAVLHPMQPAGAQDRADLDISFRGSIERGQPIVTMIVENRSARPICVAADTLRNPNTPFIHLEFRNARRQILEPTNFDPLERAIAWEQVRGVARLNPGVAAAARLNVRSRVSPSEMLGFPNGWRARATFHYGYCRPPSRCVPTPTFDCTDTYTEAASSRWRHVSPSRQ